MIECFTKIGLENMISILEFFSQATSITPVTHSSWPLVV